MFDLNSNLVAQGNAGLARFNPALAQSGTTKAMNPTLMEQGASNYGMSNGTAITNLSQASPTTGSQQNDLTQTNKYLSALKSYGDMRKTAIEMDRGPQTESALPGSQWTPQQMQAFFSALGNTLGAGKNNLSGLNQLLGNGFGNPPSPPPDSSLASWRNADGSRFANDPFKVNYDALR